MRIERHVPVRHAANPYDPSWAAYYAGRGQAQRAATVAGRERLPARYARQGGRCVPCGQRFTAPAAWQVQQRQGRVYGGDDAGDNRERWHANGHRQKHRRRMETKGTAPRAGRS